MPPVRKSLPRRHGPTHSKGVTAFQQARRSIPDGYREVFTRGVPFGAVHLVAIHDLTSEDKTVCGNWPGHTPAPKADQQKCPVCWKDRE